MKQKRITLADIADSLKISKSTVSFVLNGKGDQFNISKATQKLIFDKVKELNYVPNFFAKGLREGRTQTIGLVLADISNPFYSELSKSIQEALYEKGYTLFIVSTNDDKNMELKLIRDLILRSVDALIIAPCNKVTELKPIIDESPIPVVWVDRIGDEFADFVGINNYQEATLLVKKFSKKPAKIGILKPEQSNVMTIQLRIDGAKTACDKEHIPYLEASIKDFSDQSVAQIQQLLDAGVDSFLALNNRVALNTVNILKKLNVSIPTQARIISFDDSVAFPYFHPAITALSQPVDEIGKESAERVLKRLKESSENRKHLMLECTFIERGSH